MNLYVGNLPFSVTEDELQSLFSQYGDVDRAQVITDRETGRSRGFGFVEMEDQAAQEAMEALNGREHGGRSLTVNEARPKNDRGGGGGRR
jgi:RNA recognition motif-containing protein